MHLENTVVKLFHFQLHLKLYHWQTRSAPRHAAAESLLGKLQQFTDDVVEFCQGRHNNRIDLSQPQMLTLENVVESGKDYGKDLVESLCEEIEDMQCDDQAIDNKRQEFLGEVERTLYLFSLR